MNVSQIIKNIDEAEKLTKTLLAGLDALGTDDMSEMLSITQYMAFQMVDVCQDYVEMLKGCEVDVHYGCVKGDELPFS